MTWESLADHGRIAAIPEGHRNFDQASGLALHRDIRPVGSSASFCLAGETSQTGHRRVIALRHQVCLLERQLHGRVRYRPAERAVLEALSLDPPKYPCLSDEVVVSGWRSTFGVQILESPIKLDKCRSGQT